jgi:glycosyltransferase involved in cell wall biosynthesis
MLTQRDNHRCIHPRGVQPPANLSRAQRQEGEHRPLATNAPDNHSVLIGIDASRVTGVRLTGTERYARAVIGALMALAPRHRFRLYLRQPLDEEGWPNEQSAERIVLTLPRLWTHLALGRALLASPPDALFIPAHVLPFSFAHPGLRRRVRSVVTIHDAGYRHFPTAHPLAQRLYLDLSTRFALRFAGAVVVDSEVTRSDLLRFYGRAAEQAKIVVAHPGPLPLPAISEAEAQCILARLGLTGDSPYVVHVGTLQPRKNLRRLIRAWARLTRDPGLANARLVLAGGAGWGREDLWAEIVAGAQGAVMLTGYVSDAEKAALLRGARAYVFPSLYEGFGFPVLEAQAAGLPLACSRTPALLEVAGQAALYFDPFDEVEMAAVLRTIMTDEALRRHLVAAGWHNVRRFSWQTCAQTILSQLI